MTNGKIKKWENAKWGDEKMSKATYQDWKNES
jgi:hypothetical protein